MTGSIVATDDFYVVFQGKSTGTATHPAGQALTATDGTFTGTVDVNGNELILDADADTSITADTDDRIDFKTGGTDAMHIDGSQNVGIGETAPLGHVHIKSEDTGVSSVSAQGDLLVLEGTETGLSILSATSAAGYINFGDSDDNDIGILIYDHSANAMKFFVNASERMRINSDGHVGINDTNPSEAQLSVVTQQNESAAFIHCNASSMTGATLAVSSSRNTTGGTYSHLECAIHGVAVKMKVLDGGDVKNTNNSYGAISDQRMKENIVDAASQWDDIKALQVRKYNRIGETQKELGVIAQELEASGMGGLVEEGQWYDVDNNSDDETRKSVKYSVLYMKAVKALQEAMTRIETLETQNTTQATQIADLITRVTALEDA
jgi:hypothetical protein